MKRLQIGLRNESLPVIEVRSSTSQRHESWRKDHVRHLLQQNHHFVPTVTTPPILPEVEQFHVECRVEYGCTLDVVNVSVFYR